MLVAAVVVGGFSGTADAAWVNGRWVYPFKYFTNKQVSRRPVSSTDKGLSLAHWRIDRVPTDAKGLQVYSTRYSSSKPAWAYRWIAIWHCEISNVWRSGPGIHNDFIHIVGGGGLGQDVPTTVLLQDIAIHDGNGIPIMIQDGWFDKITLRDIRVWNTTTNVQIATINSGSVGEIYIENSPNIRVAIMGRPGTVKRVYIKNCPGASISDVACKYGKTGAQIIHVR